MLRFDPRALTEEPAVRACVPLFLAALLAARALPALLDELRTGGATAAALVTAGLSVVALPPLAPTRLRRLHPVLVADTPRPALELLGHRPMGTQD